MKRALPLLIMAICGSAGWLCLRDVDAEALRTYHLALREVVDRHSMLAPVIGTLAYAGVVAGFLPIALWMSVILGYAFGTAWGGILSILGATLGALLTYLAARTGLGRPFSRWAEPWLGRFEQGSHDGMWSYLLIVRLVPVMPFWLVNISAALLKVPLWTYLLTTALGIAPATFVLAGVGAGLTSVFAKGGRPDLAIMTDPKVLWPLLGISALVPVIWRKLRASPS